MGLKKTQPNHLKNIILVSVRVQFSERKIPSTTKNTKSNPQNSSKGSLFYIASFSWDYWFFSPFFFILAHEDFVLGEEHGEARAVTLLEPDTAASASSPTHPSPLFLLVQFFLQLVIVLADGGIK